MSNVSPGYVAPHIGIGLQNSFSFWIKKKAGLNETVCFTSQPCLGMSVCKGSDWKDTIDDDIGEIVDVAGDNQVVVQWSDKSRRKHIFGTEVTPGINWG